MIITKDDIMIINAIIEEGSTLIKLNVFLQDTQNQLTSEVLNDFLLQILIDSKNELNIIKLVSNIEKLASLIIEYSSKKQLIQC